MIEHRNAAVDADSMVISAPGADGQFHGVDRKGANAVFSEHGVYDPDSGTFLASGSTDDMLPRAGCIRSISVGARPLPFRPNVLGAHGLGDADCGGASAAVMDAFGVPDMGCLDVPLVPNGVWQPIRNADQLQ